VFCFDHANLKAARKSTEEECAAKIFTSQAVNFFPKLGSKYMRAIRPRIPSERTPEMRATHFLDGLMMRASWLVHAPGFMLFAAIALTVVLAAVCWPRGCCKEDSVFSRKTV
jgi:hypothetical protein